MTAWVEFGTDNRVEGRCDACPWHLASVFVPGRRRGSEERLRDALLMAVAARSHEAEFCEARDGQLGLGL